MATSVVVARTKSDGLEYLAEGVMAWLAADEAVKPGSGNGAFLSCLLARRANLSQACLTVLQDHNVL